MTETDLAAIRAALAAVEEQFPGDEWKRHIRALIAFGAPDSLDTTSTYALVYPAPEHVRALLAALDDRDAEIARLRGELAVLSNAYSLSVGFDEPDHSPDFYRGMNYALSVVRSRARRALEGTDDANE